MSQVSLPQSVAADVAPPSPKVFQNLSRYLLTRLSILLFTVVTAVYLTILIANFGGYVDEIIRSQIDLQITGAVQGGWLRDIPADERPEIIEQTRQAMQEAAGLNQPFLLRSFRWLSNGLTLNWGEANRPTMYAGGTFATEVRLIILDHLPRTLLVFGTANVLLFFATTFLALALTRKYGSRLDKLFVALTPLSAAPAWVYGVILSFVFLQLFTFSTGGTFDAWPDEFQLSYLPIMLKHLATPFLAIFISGLFQGVYAWRTFFLVYANEDYVDMARAKGLSARMIERRHILRPALPGLVTSFALMAMSLWQEIIALEYFFNVAGIGRVFITALRLFDIPVIVGLVVTFAYLLAITVFVLDIVYAFVDPRVRIGNQGKNVSVTAQKQPKSWRFWARKRPLQPTPKIHPDRLEPPAENVKRWPSPLGVNLWTHLRNGGRILRQLADYPSAVVGLVIILALIAVSIYTVTAIPYEEAIALWRGEGDVWDRNPKDALPAWINFFRVNDLPPTIILDSRDDNVSKNFTAISEEMTDIIISFPFAFPYGEFPQDVVVYFEAEYEEKHPHITLTWLTPDGREIELDSFSTRQTQVYHFSQDSRLQRKLGGRPPQQALFADPNRETAVPLQGTYELQVSGLVFEENANLDVEFVIFGQVYGLAGTDSNRRDLMVALLWGTPIALAFGLLAAGLTSVSSMFLAAIGAWFGGWVDRWLQFLTEVNLILPFFPVSLMIFTLYSKSIWVILSVIVLLNIFGNATKTYRATFLQIKESPYIEAAQAYGASNWRIVSRYLIPRIVAVLIPKLVILVPAYVFLEATLAFLGVSDPVFPTWGKLVVAALSSGIQRGVYHIVLAPLGVLFLTGFAFAMVGLALERIFEPRLRER